MKLTKKIILLLAFCSLSISFVGCGGQQNKSGQKPTEQISSESSEASEESNTLIQVPLNQVEQMNAQADEQSSKIKELQEQVGALEGQVEELITEKTFYDDYIKKVVAEFTAEQLQGVADKEWTYSLKINDIAFPKSGVIEISKSTFNLALTEERVKYSYIDPDLSESKRYDGKMGSALNFSSSQEYEKTEEKPTNYITKVLYKFKNLSPGTTINIGISENLQNKLDLATPNLKIKVIK